MSKVFGHKFRLERSGGRPDLEGYFRGQHGTFLSFYDEAGEILEVAAATVDVMRRIGGPKDVAAAEDLAVSDNPEEDDTDD